MEICKKFSKLRPWLLIKQNRKSDDDDDAVRKLCSQSADCLTNTIQVQILMTSPVWYKIRLQTFIISHFRLFRSPKI